MLDNIKLLFWEKKSQLELWFRSLPISSVDVIRYASCFGVGFLSGLLFKRWSKYIILMVVSVTIVFAILQGFSIITINFTTIEKLTGLQNITNIPSLFVTTKQTIQKYSWETLFFGLGFITGFKTG